MPPYRLEKCPCQHQSTVTTGVIRQALRIQPFFDDATSATRRACRTDGKPIDPLLLYAAINDIAFEPKLRTHLLADSLIHMVLDGFSIPAIPSHYNCIFKASATSWHLPLHGLANLLAAIRNDSNTATKSGEDDDRIVEDVCAAAKDLLEVAASQVSDLTSLEAAGALNTPRVAVAQFIRAVSEYPNMGMYALSFCS